MKFITHLMTFFHYPQKPNLWMFPSFTKYTFFFDNFFPTTDFVCAFKFKLRKDEKKIAKNTWPKFTSSRFFFIFTNRIFSKNSSQKVSKTCIMQSCTFIIIKLYDSLKKEQKSSMKNNDSFSINLWRIEFFFKKEI